MFGNKKRDKKIKDLEENLDFEIARVVRNTISDFVDIGLPISKEKNRFGDYKLDDHEINVKLMSEKLKALEDYLQIEYKEESTKGYVKKENVFEVTRKALEGKEMWTQSGRKSNNKKK